MDCTSVGAGAVFEHGVSDSDDAAPEGNSGSGYPAELHDFSSERQQPGKKKKKVPCCTGIGKARHRWPEQVMGHNPFLGSRSFRAAG